METVVVTAAWRASYERPLRVAAGETLRLTGRTDDWEGHTWLWAIAPDGLEGWVPDDLGERRGETLVAGRDYWAVELTCAAGAVLTRLEQSHGWSWCVADDGAAGWVPSQNLDNLRG
jgi:hypothetical protein